MKKIYILILLIIIFIVLYFLIKTQTILNYKEEFTTIVGTSDPLVTYDDYGTFNFIHHFNDLPYYDPTYNIISDYTKNRMNQHNKKKEIKLKSEHFDDDSFFELCGCKIRKKLIPSNYAETKNSHFIKYVSHDNLPEQYVLEKNNTASNITLQTTYNRNIPQPYNYYFNN